jgi:hypothetical protein
MVLIHGPPEVVHGESSKALRSSLTSPGAAEVKWLAHIQKTIRCQRQPDYSL